MSSQLSAEQLASAVEVAEGCEVITLGCFDPPKAIAVLPLVNLARLHEGAGESYHGEDRTDLFILALPLVTALGVASAKDKQ